MPGKLFAVIEEIVLNLSVYIAGYSANASQTDISKALGLSGVLAGYVIQEVVIEKEFGNMIMVVNLLRLVVLLQSSFDQK